MPKAGYSSVTLNDEVLEIAFDLSEITDWSVPQIIERALRFYKREKIEDLKRRAKALE